MAPDAGGGKEGTQVMSGNNKIHPDVPKYARCPRCAALVRRPDNLPYCCDVCRTSNPPRRVRSKKGILENWRDNDT